MGARSAISRLRGPAQADRNSSVRPVPVVPSWPATLGIAGQPMSFGLVHLLLEQGTKFGGAAGSRLVLLECLLHFVVVLGTDRQLQHATLAVHAGELRLDLVAHLQMLGGILDAFLGDVVGAQIAF